MYATNLQVWVYFEATMSLPRPELNNLIISIVWFSGTRVSADPTLTSLWRVDMEFNCLSQSGAVNWCCHPKGALAFWSPPTFVVIPSALLQCCGTISYELWGIERPVTWVVLMSQKRLKQRIKIPSLAKEASALIQYYSHILYELKIATTLTSYDAKNLQDHLTLDFQGDRSSLLFLFLTRSRRVIMIYFRWSAPLASQRRDRAAESITSWARLLQGLGPKILYPYKHNAITNRHFLLSLDLLHQRRIISTHGRNHPPRYQHQCKQQ